MYPREVKEYYKDAYEKALREGYHSLSFGDFVEKERKRVLKALRKNAIFGYFGKNKKNKSQNQWIEIIEILRKKEGIPKFFPLELMQKVAQIGDIHELETLFSFPNNELIQSQDLSSIMVPRSDDLIKSQSDTQYNFIAEWVSNAIDASSPHKQIGRFGEGFFQSLGYLENINGSIEVESRSKDSEGYKIGLQKRGEKIYVAPEKSEKKEKGTNVRFKKILRKQEQKDIYDTLVKKFGCNTRANIYINGKYINSLGNFSSLEFQNNDILSLPQIDIYIDENGVEIQDKGSGMDFQTIAQKLLYPNTTTKKRKKLNDTEVKKLSPQETIFFYREKESPDQKTRIRLQIAGVMIEEFHIVTLGNIGEYIFEFPSFSPLEDSRNEIKVSRETTISLISALKKISETPYSQEEKLSLLEIIGAIYHHLKGRPSNIVDEEFSLETQMKKNFGEIQKSLEDEGICVLPTDETLVNAFGIRKDIFYIDADFVNFKVETIPEIMEISGSIIGKKTGKKYRFFELNFDIGAKHDYVIYKNNIFINRKIFNGVSEAQKNAIIQVLNISINLNTGYELDAEKVFYGRIPTRSEGNIEAYPVEIEQLISLPQNTQDISRDNSGNINRDYTQELAYIEQELEIFEEKFGEKLPQSTESTRNICLKKIDPIYRKNIDAKRKMLLEQGENIEALIMQIKLQMLLGREEVVLHPDILKNFEIFSILVDFLERKNKSITVPTFDFLGDLIGKMQGDAAKCLLYIQTLFRAIEQEPKALIEIMKSFISKETIWEDDPIVGNLMRTPVEIRDVSRFGVFTDIWEGKKNSQKNSSKYGDIFHSLISEGEERSDYMKVDTLGLWFRDFSDYISKRELPRNNVIYDIFSSFVEHLDHKTATDEDMFHVRKKVSLIFILENILYKVEEKQKAIQKGETIENYNFHTLSPFEAFIFEHFGNNVQNIYSILWEIKDNVHSSTIISDNFDYSQVFRFFTYEYDFSHQGKNFQDYIETLDYSRILREYGIEIPTSETQGELSENEIYENTTIIGPGFSEFRKYNEISGHTHFIDIAEELITHSNKISTEDFFKFRKAVLLKEIITTLTHLRTDASSDIEKILGGHKLNVCLQNHKLIQEYIEGYERKMGIPSRSSYFNFFYREYNFLFSQKRLYNYDTFYNFILTLDYSEVVQDIFGNKISKKSTKSGDDKDSRKIQLPEHFFHSLSKRYPSEIVAFAQFLESDGEYLTPQDSNIEMSERGVFSTYLSKIIETSFSHHSKIFPEMQLLDFADILSSFSKKGEHLHDIISGVCMAQDEVSLYFLREGVQNARDALISAGIFERDIEIDFYARDGKFTTSMSDSVGMNLSDIISKLLTPYNSGKNGIHTTGKFGKGFFTFAVGCSEIRIKTGTGNGRSTCLKMIPQFRYGIIYDFEIFIQEKIEDFKGTLIERVDELGGIQGNLRALVGTQLLRRYVGNTEKIGIQFAGNTLNDGTNKTLVAESPEIQDQSGKTLGTLRLYTTKDRNERFTKDHLWISEIKEDILKDFPDWVVHFIRNMHYSLDIPAQTPLVGSRNSLENREYYLSLFRPHFYKMMIETLLREHVSGNLKIPMMPEDYLALLDYESRGTGKVKILSQKYNSGVALSTQETEQLKDTASFAEFLTEIEFEYEGKIISLRAIKKSLHEEAFERAKFGNRFSLQLERAYQQKGAINQKALKYNLTYAEITELVDIKKTELLKFKKFIAERFESVIKKRFGGKYKISFHTNPRGGEIANSYSSTGFGCSFNIDSKEFKSLIQNINSPLIQERILNIVAHEMTHNQEDKLGVRKWGTHETDETHDISFMRINREILTELTRSI